MSTPIIHPNWARPAINMVEGYSLEMTAKDIDALREAAPAILPETPVAVTFLPGEAFEARVAAARAVRDLGFEPMPHFSARRIASESEFRDYLAAVTQQAGVKRCFVIAGDPPEPEGPFADSSALIATGAFEAAGITAIGIGGHPEGHPNMSPDQCWAVLDAKCDAITARGMAPLIVTQFAFDAGAVLDWLAQLRRRGLDAPVRLGVPGPAGIKTLMRFAARCGVGASASVMTKYGISITKLIGSAGPDKLVDALERGLGEEHGAVRLHFYPFGGLAKTVGWINDYAATR
ncbi:methylenetetrahydrofolate reductase [Novosphingobium sp. 1949]|uniref:Methylenetetrahydrofolate reductase n=1 Tax=Novosphingobium organovorum TaxID=2930092 RepID=A0ABT0B9M2_9SPHN|nr:methylenetetrahydrofolate reductase [Novosphingobium organovorum]MCJ2181775.1 methylenetetrahydrofolate reductase [Novosphingobium organovorum]